MLRYYILGLIVGFLIYSGVTFSVGNPLLIGALLDAGPGGIAVLSFWGVLAAVLIAVFLPKIVSVIVANDPDYRYRSHIARVNALGLTQDTPPSELPAAAVSVLRGREVTDRTLGAIVVEMCQKGILRVRPVAKTAGDSSSHDFRLIVAGQPRYEWERDLCAAMRGREVTHEWVKETLSGRRSEIGKQLVWLLRQGGLFDRNPIRSIPWVYGLTATTVGLMAGALAMSFVGMVAVGASPLSAMMGLALTWGVMGLFFAIILMGCIGKLKFANRPGPNRTGKDEIDRWLLFRTFMWRLDRPTEEDADRPYPYPHYAFALGVDKPWMFARLAGVLPPTTSASTAVTRSSDTATDGDFRLVSPADRFFFAWIAADYVGTRLNLGLADSGNFGSDLDSDFDIDFDLSL